MTDDLVKRITAYLSGGGLFNPELANHDVVRDLLIDCRARIEALEKRLEITPEAEGYDGIYCRDETIKKLEAGLSACKETADMEFTRYLRANERLMDADARLRAAQEEIRRFEKDYSELRETYDAQAIKLAAAQEALQIVKRWHDKDGSVGGASVMIEEVRAALAEIKT